MSRIALIMPYFGTLPNYFSVWLTSCRFNPTIDWYLFTDDRTQYDYPDNVHVIYVSFEEMKNRFQRCFDFEVALERPYKLCDFKPTYGLVFADYLVGYDFWGHGDMDLVFGNIRLFITQDILGSHDRILCHGHFSLYRNNDRMNNMFKHDIKGRPRFKEVYQSLKSHSFDEYGDEAIHTICRSQEVDTYINNTFFADLTSFKRHFVLTWCYVPTVMRPEEKEQAQWEENNDQTCTIFSFNEGQLKRLYIDQGQLCERDYMYVHFQKRQMTMSLSDENANQFMAVPNQFIDFIQPCDKATVERLGRKRFISSRRWRRRLRVFCRLSIKKWFGI